MQTHIKVLVAKQGPPGAVSAGDASIPDAAFLADGRMLAAVAGVWTDVPQPAGVGDMTATMYDPQGHETDAFDRANHTGQQAITSVTGLQTALNLKLEASQINSLAKLNALVNDATLDSALSPRPPSAHASDHALAGTDPLTPAAIGAALAADFDQALRTTSAPTFAQLILANEPTATAHAASKGYVDNLLQGLVWQAPARDQVDFTSAEPAAPSVGDRYINTQSGTASSSGQAVAAHYIYRYNGTGWQPHAPTNGWAIWVENTNALLTFNGTEWVGLGSASNHNSLTSLQGGAPSDYYHLTSAQHAALLALVINSPYARANHTGSQAIATITGLATALGDKLDRAAVDTLAELNSVITDATLANRDGANTWTAQQTFTDVVETVYNLTGNEINRANGGIQYKVLNGAVTFIDALNSGESVTLRIENDSAYSVTWPTMSWIGGTAPTLGPNDQVVLWKEGAVLRGTHLGSF